MINHCSGVFIIIGKFFGEVALSAIDPQYTLVGVHKEKGSLVHTTGYLKC